MLKKSKKRISLVLTTIILSGLVMTGCQSGGSKKLVLYSALNEDDMVQITKQFKEDTDIDIEHIRGGAGDMSARVLAEKGSPNADVLVGGSVDVYEPLAKEDVLMKYDSPNNDNLDPMFNDPDGYWQGWYMGVLGLIINKDRFDEELASKGIEYPKTWDDLLDPAYKEIFVTSNPATAGGAYIFTANQIFRLGEEKAWDYFKELDKNVHHYYKGAGDCISPVATGEFVVGMSWVHDIYKQVKAGYPIEVVIPDETAFEIGGAAIIKGSKNEENAKIFIDWLLTEKVGAMNTELSNRYSVLDSVASPEGLPAISDVNLVDYDRNKAGEMKTHVVDKYDQDILSKR